MSDMLAPLLSHPAIWRASRFQNARDCQQQTAQGLATGFSRLDRELPDHGWPRSGVLEMLLSHKGRGELSVLAPALAELSHGNRWIAWIAPPWIPYAPALLRHGIRTERVLLIRPAQLRDCLWALEQCMSSGTCAAVLGWPEALQPQHVKRLQLAAQQGQCLGVLMRDARHAQSPSPAPLRLEIGSQRLLPGGQVQCELRLIKRRGRWPSDWFPVQWASPVVAAWSEIPPLARATQEVVAATNGIPPPSGAEPPKPVQPR